MYILYSELWWYNKHLNFGWHTLFLADRMVYRLSFTYCTSSNFLCFLCIKYNILFLIYSNGPKKRNRAMHIILFLLKLSFVSVCRLNDGDNRKSSADTVVVDVIVVACESMCAFYAWICMRLLWKNGVVFYAICIGEKNKDRGKTHTHTHPSQPNWMYKLLSYTKNIYVLYIYIYVNINFRMNKQ